MKTLIRMTLGLLAGLAVTVQAAPDGGERLQFADGLFARGMHALAVREYDGYLKSGATGRLDVAYFRLGECYHALGQLLEAEKAYRFVAQAGTGSVYRARADYKRAMIFRALGRVQETIGLLTGLVREALPDEVLAPALYLLGEAQEEVQNVPAAIATYERLRALEAKGAEGTVAFRVYALLRLGFLQARQPGASAVALTMYEEALRVAPTDRLKAEALFQLAELKFTLGDYVASAPLFLQLLATYPADTRVNDARLHGAWAAHKAGRYADALALTQKGIAAGDAQLQDWLYLKANSERQLGNLAAAAAVYARLVDEFKDGRFADAARYELALTHYRDRQYGLAVAAAERIRLTDANRKDVYWLLAQAYAALEQRDKAVQYFRLVVSEYPDSDIGAEAAYRLGFFLQEGGELAGAAEAYGALAKRYPQAALTPRALFAAGVCLTRLERHAEAVQAWTDLIKAHPGDEHIGEARYRLALGQIKLERLEDAQRTLQALLREPGASPFVADAHYWDGVLLERMQKPHDAAGAFRRALAAAPRDELARNVRFHLAVIAYDQKRYDEAATLFQMLLGTPLEAQLTPELLRWLAGYHFSHQRHPEAMAAAERLLALHTGAAWQQSGRLLIGKCLLAQGNAQLAGEAFEAVIQQGGGTSEAAEAALRSGDILLERGAAERARGRYAEAADWASAPGDLGIRARAYFGLGKAARILKDPDAASRFFLSVAVLYDDPEIVPECLSSAAAIFEEMGRGDEAAKLRAELQQRYPQSILAQPAASPAGSGVGRERGKP